MDQQPPSFWISVRFMIAIIAFFGYAVQYIQRINMSVAIVCMVNNTAIKQMRQSSSANLTSASLISNTSILSQDTCLFKELKGAQSLDGEFVWDKKIQGLILSSYFYGYITTQIAGGYLSMKFGAKLVLGGAILIGSLLTLAMPYAAQISYTVLALCRFFTGVAHGSFWPSMSSLWSQWAPPTERSRLAGIANAGAQIGNVIALPLGGFLCVYGFAGGWPSIFYVFGSMGIVWFVAWMILAAKSPSHHRFISEREKQYILEQTSDANSNTNKQPVFQIAKKILKSKAFYGVMWAHTASNFGTYLFLTQLPTYMKEILKFDIKSNGGLSALPYIIFWLFTIVSSIIGDKLIQSKVFSKTTVRKLFNLLGFLLPMTAVIGLGFVTCAIPYVGVALLTLGLAFTGCAYGAGFMVNYNDIAGSYAGLTFGMANTAGTVPGFVAPYMVGLLTTHQKQEEWQIVFFITAAVYLSGAIAFLILGSGETQPWAKNKAVKDVEEGIPLNRK